MTGPAGRRRLMAPCVLIGLLLLTGGAGRLLAHDPLGFDGTVVKMDLAKGVLTIDTIDNGQDAKIDITFDAKTTVTQAGKKVSRAALKPGVHVIVDALGCIDEAEIDGVAVRIVPPGSRAGSAALNGGQAGVPGAELGTEIPKGDRVPTVRLQADVPEDGNWSFNVVTSLTLTETTGPYRPMQGHLHIYVDGKETLMIATPHFTLTDLAPGPHTVKVVLSGTDHRSLLHGGVPIADSLEIVVPPTHH